MRPLSMVLLFGLAFGLAFALASKMMKSRWGRVLFAVGCVLTASALFADVISGILGYRSFYTDIRDTAFITNPYAMKLAAVILAFICYLAVGEMMRRIFRGQLRLAVFFLVGWLVIYWSAMFGFSGKQLFGCKNDYPYGPCYSYVEFLDGQIALRDISLTDKPDPETGRILKPLTPGIADKYRQQQAGKKTSSFSPSFWHRLFESSPANDAELQMEIEKIEILPDKTILHFAVWRTDNSRLGRFYKPYGWNYLSDETGQTYDLVQDNAAYPSSDWVDSKSHKPWVDDDSSGKVALTKVVRPDETYRFTDEYPPLKPDVRQLRLHDSRFAQVDLDFQLKLARVQEEIQKLKEQELVKQSALDAETQKLKEEQELREQIARDKEREEQAIPPSQPPSPVVVAREPPAPVVPPPQSPIPALQPASPPQATSAPPPVTHAGTWARFGATTQVGAPDSDPAAANSAPSARTVPAKTKPPVPVILAGMSDSDWMVSRRWGRPELAVVWIELERGFTDLQISARLKNPLRARNLSDARIFTTYLKDDKGRVYRFREGSPILKLYPDGTGADQYRPYSGSLYILEAGELYMFRMSFDLLREDVRELTFYRNDYPPMKLTRQLQEFYSSKRQ